MHNYFSTGVKKVIGTGREVVGMKKSGLEFPIHLSISEVHEDGFHLFTAIIRDLTEIREEENYRQSTETQMMWKVDSKGKVQELNQKFKDYIGIFNKEEEAAADVFSSSVVHPDEYKAGREMFAKANQIHKPFEMKRRLKSQNGIFRWFMTKGIPVFDTKGAFKFWCGSCSDINDSVMMELELADLKAKMIDK